MYTDPTSSTHSINLITLCFIFTICLPSLCYSLPQCSVKPFSFSLRFLCLFLTHFVPNLSFCPPSLSLSKVEPAADLRAAFSGGGAAEGAPGARQQDGGCEWRELLPPPLPTSVTFCYNSSHHEPDFYKWSWQSNVWIKATKCNSAGDSWLIVDFGLVAQVWCHVTFCCFKLINKVKSRNQPVLFLNLHQIIIIMMIIIIILFSLTSSEVYCRFENVEIVPRNENQSSKCVLEVS